MNGQWFFIPKVQLEISFSSETVITELVDLNEIQQVSRKLTDESEESRLKVQTKTRLGRSSIYVEALQSTLYQRRFPDRSKE